MQLHCFCVRCNCRTVDIARNLFINTVRQLYCRTQRQKQLYCYSTTYIMNLYTIAKDSSIYFCTDTIISFAYVFTEKALFEIIINSLKHCQKEKGLKVHAYVIMLNHVHTIVSANDGVLYGILRDYKRFTSQEITKTLSQSGKSQLLTLFRSTASRALKDNQYKVWQSGSHPQLMDYDEKLFQKIEYIHNNPVRKGFVDKPEDWVYSSARNYAVNDNSIIEIDRIF